MFVDAQTFAAVRCANLVPWEASAPSTGYALLTVGRGSGASCDAIGSQVAVVFRAAADRHYTLDRGLSNGTYEVTPDSATRPSTVDVTDGQLLFAIPKQSAARRISIGIALKRAFMSSSIWRACEIVLVR